jgi:hypothetical protein
VPNGRATYDAEKMGLWIGEASRALVSFIGRSSSGRSEVFGTGAVILADSLQALVLTARHVFEGIADYQGNKPHRTHHPTALPEFLPPEPDTLGHLDISGITAVHVASGQVAICDVRGIVSESGSDLLLCLVAYQQHSTGPLFGPRLALDTRPPRVGDQVLQLSFAGMRVFDQYRLPHEGDGELFKMANRPSLRIGRVTELGFGIHGRRYPTLACTIPAEPGMSGGVVFRNRSDEPPSICGVISSGISYCGGEESPSVCALVFPIVYLPLSIQFGSGQRVDTVLDAIRAGLIQDLGDAPSHIHIETDVDGARRLQVDVNAWKTRDQ